MTTHHISLPERTSPAAPTSDDSMAPDVEADGKDTCWCGRKTWANYSCEGCA